METKVTGEGVYHLIEIMVDERQAIQSELIEHCSRNVKVCEICRLMEAGSNEEGYQSVIYQINSLIIFC